MLALETCAKGSGSMRLTFLLAYRVRFCCLLRPQLRSQRFPASIPCSPFAQALQSLRKKLPHSREAHHQPSSSIAHLLPCVYRYF